MKIFDKIILKISSTKIGQTNIAGNFIEDKGKFFLSLSFVKFGDKIFYKRKALREEKYSCQIEQHNNCIKLSRAQAFKYRCWFSIDR